MKATQKALLLAGLHVALVAGLGAKFLYDRSTRPRYWLKAVPVDPDLPIRGRYVSLRVEVPVPGFKMPNEMEPDNQKPIINTRSDGTSFANRFSERPKQSYRVAVTLVPDTPGLMARENPPESYLESRVSGAPNGTIPGSSRNAPVVILDEPLACFIPEKVPDPSRRQPGEELWVEVTVPRKGPLRPIRLGVKKDGRLEVLPY